MQMQVNSEMVGRKMKFFQVEVTQRQINNYAAAVFDPNPCYLDDTRDEGVIGPPTLGAAITWPLIQNIYDFIDLEFPAEIMFHLVHYSEQLIINRLLEPGDQLTIKGEIAAVLPGKKGTHVIFRLPAFDLHGNPVFTEYLGGMLRDVECIDRGRVAGSLPTLPPAPATSGAPLWESSIPIPREACYLYEGCANVPFPIHTSPAFAKAMGLPDIIYFGVGTLARAVRELVNRELQADPTKIEHLACHFRGMVLPDSFIRIQLLAKTEKNKHLEFHFRVLNREGKDAVSEGYLRTGR
jgi:acyl dehydratase